MNNANNNVGDKYFRQALTRLEEKSDRNTGGTLLGKRMVHRNAKAYNRRDVRQRDRRCDY